jgi:hypothetical protein
MRDVDIKEVEIDDIEAEAANYIDGPESEVEILDNGKGTIIYNITNSGLPERLTFSLIE